VRVLLYARDPSSHPTRSVNVIDRNQSTDPTREIIPATGPHLSSSTEWPGRQAPNISSDSNSHIKEQIKWNRQ